MADANRYRLTTTPIKLGAVEIRNRFYLSPHGVGYNVGYEPSDVFAEYYRVRAAGGCGCWCTRCRRCRSAAAEA